ncbi:MAG: FKBP-type peptidyl-prolyl cis-trans isomerase [Vicinamibacterales bacterium]
MPSQPVAALILVSALSISIHARQPSPAVKPTPAPPDVAAPAADATKTASGLSSKMLQTGTGTTKPTVNDLVTVHYAGWTTDGKMFDSSYSDNAPRTFPLNRVIKGWGEGVQLMVVGERRRFWIPEALAYQGQTGRPKGMLVFDIELVGIAASPRVPPPDVAAVPADATTTASGLAYKVLRNGTGTVHPARTSRVTVHYTGWTTDGKMFDTSVEKGQPITFGINQVIEGWGEGVQLMVAGEKTRFWIPEQLAYKGQDPKGLLVFDVELISIAPTR